MIHANRDEVGAVPQIIRLLASAIARLAAISVSLDLVFKEEQLEKIG
jgi:hypothetical protein